MPTCRKSFRDVATGTGTVRAVSSIEQSTRTGRLFRNGNLIQIWSHEQLATGVVFDIDAPNRYQVVVDIVFVGRPESVTVVCKANNATRTCSITGDTNDNVADLGRAHYLISTRQIL